MLVLTRKRSEMIRIGDDILVKVIRTGRGSVKIGIDAPGHVRVLRAELCEHPPLFEVPETLELSKSESEYRETAAITSDQFPHPHIA